MNVMVRLHNSEALKETLTYGIRILFYHRGHPRSVLLGTLSSRDLTVTSLNVRYDENQLERAINDDK